MKTKRIMITDGERWVHVDFDPSEPEESIRIAVFAVVKELLTHPVRQRSE